MVNSLGQRNIDEEEMVFITVRVGICHNFNLKSKVFVTETNTFAEAIIHTCIYIANR